jgi:hypothetical protein
MSEFLSPYLINNLVTIKLKILVTIGIGVGPSKSGKIDLFLIASFTMKRFSINEPPQSIKIK